MTAKLRDALLGPGGGRSRLAPIVPQRLRVAEQSNGEAGAWSMVKWERPCSALSRMEIRP
jgi:hypothetical protein